MASLMEYRRRILLNTPHLETVSGSVAHFNTDMSAKLKECKVNFLPQQAGSGDPSPSNVRAISGWTGCDVVHSGKNIVDVVGYSAINHSSNAEARRLANTYGTTISTTDFSLPDTPVVITQSQWDESVAKSSFRNGYIVINLDNLTFGQSYNVSFRVSNITNNPLNAIIDNIRMSNPYGNYVDAPIVIGDRLFFKNCLFRQSDSVPGRSSFQINVCGMSFSLSEFMVTPVEDEDYTYAPYDPDKITVSWDNLGTIYGGFIDVLRGELVQEWETVDFSDVSWVTTSQTSVFRGVLNDHELTNQINILSDSYKSVNATVTIAEMVDKTVKTHEANSTYVYCKDTDYTTVSDFITATTGKKIVYKLATPITYPLSPEIIKAIKGVNNVFSDAGDVEVRFWTH